MGREVFIMSTEEIREKILDSLWSFLDAPIKDCYKTENGFVLKLEDGSTFQVNIKKDEELEKDEIYVLLQQLKEVNNTDSNDFLEHIKRTAKAIIRRKC
jgi:hypothetical protein